MSFFGKLDLTKKMAFIGVLFCLGGGLSVSSLLTERNSASLAYSHSEIEGRLAFSGFRSGSWDIYTIRADGTDLRQVTVGGGDDLSPSWSPDGKKLAFQSNRDGNWEIYVLSLGDNTTQRLTVDQSYDGSPVWSPDGKRIAFESYRNGDLDILVMNADGTDQMNLTISCSAADFAPAWSPDGKYLSFTSVRMGDSDLFILDVTTQNVAQWTDTPQPEHSGIWSPDGQFLIFVQDAVDSRELYAGKVSDPPMKGGPTLRLTWFSRDDSPAWSTTGEYIAYVSHQHTDLDMEYLLLQATGQFDGKADAIHLFSRPIVLLSGWEITGPLSWTQYDFHGGEAVRDFVPVTDVPFSPGLTRPKGEAVEDTTSLPDHFEDLLDVEAPNARLNSKLVASFEHIRRTVIEKAGYDFLAELSDMWRGLDARDEGSAYLSWHKAGRAFDILFDYRDVSNYPLLKVVREDIAGETFWRVFLKAALQDGSMGMPLKVAPWDLSGKARRKYPDYGGWWESIPYGYYVDLTEIIRHEGWERISSVNREDFSWKWHFLGIEYWHYQRRDGLQWYHAMNSIYPKERLDELYTWSRLVQVGEKPYNIFVNGIPVPPAANEWLDLQY